MFPVAKTSDYTIRKIEPGVWGIFRHGNDQNRQVAVKSQLEGETFCCWRETKAKALDAVTEMVECRNLGPTA